MLSPRTHPHPPLPFTLTLTRTLTLTLTQRADPNQAVPLSHVPQGALADHVLQARTLTLTLTLTLAP